MAEITLETNLKVVFGGDATAEMPQAQKDLFVSLRVWHAMAKDESLVIGITRMEMKPAVPLNVDGAIKGGLNEAIKKAGDATPKFEIEVVKVSGLEGRRASYEGTAPIRAEAIVARDGQKLYQIQVFFTPARAEDAQRIIKSVKIARTE